MPRLKARDLKNLSHSNNTPFSTSTYTVEAFASQFLDSDPLRYSQPPSILANAPEVRRFDFYALPAELRNAVYEYSTRIETQRIPVWQKGSRRASSNPDAYLLDISVAGVRLAAVSRQTKAEISEYLTTALSTLSEEPVRVILNKPSAFASVLVKIASCLAYTTTTCPLGRAPSPATQNWWAQHQWFACVGSHADAHTTFRGHADKSQSVTLIVAVDFKGVAEITTPGFLEGVRQEWEKFLLADPHLDRDLGRNVRIQIRVHGIGDSAQSRFHMVDPFAAHLIRLLDWDGFEVCVGDEITDYEWRATWQA